MDGSGLHMLERPLHLLVLQPTPFCNIECDYCYLADRNSGRRMPSTIVDAAARNIGDSGLLSDELGVVWHAGEPLTVPIDFYRESFRIIDRILAHQTHITHSIQTNAMLINDDWCSLFAEWDVNVGVSLDGPAFVHDRHRKTRRGQPTHQRCLAGLKLLQKYRLPSHVIAVVTRDSLGHAREIIEFFAQAGVTHVGFNIDEAEGAHSTCSLEGLEREYRRFFQTAMESADVAGVQIQIREVRNAHALISGGLPEISIDGHRIPLNSQIVPGAILSVDCEGGFSTFSPELLDLKHPSYGSFVLGNVVRDSIAESMISERTLRLQADIFAGVAACKRACAFFRFCGGGAPINKLIENRRFDSAETLYCKCSIQIPFTLTLESIEKRQGN